MPENSNVVLPERGRPWNELRAELEALQASDGDWRGGRLPAFVFHLDEATDHAVREAYAMYFSENGLGMRVFPGLARLESEVIGMGLALFNAPPGAAGSFTSGGTESLFLAVKTARDWFRAERGGTRRPNTRRPNTERPNTERLNTGRLNIVLPYSAHLALDKAAHYLDLEVRRVPLAAGFRADVAAMEAAMDSSTCLIVGSAPGYTHGCFDPIAELATLAQGRGVWLHVDACFGGLSAPFARDLGEPIPPFDFALPGVFSLSADLHKYGYAAKGASLFLLRDEALKAHQRFSSSNWPHGTYATDTFAGSRPAGAIAAAWTALNSLGWEGYRVAVRNVLDEKNRLIAGIEAIPGLNVVRPSESTVLLYTSAPPAPDIDVIAKSLTRRGWVIGRAKEPRGIHIALNGVHVGISARYLADLAASVSEAGETAAQLSGEARYN